MKPGPVSVIIVNLDGAEHLPDCLDSLRGQDYPDDLVEVIVVDNGSTDGSLELLSGRYPWVTVLAQGHNTGFAPAVNTGVSHARGTSVALVNNDMRLDPGWLAALVDASDPDRGVVCVAGQILSWDGGSVDFVEGSLNFYGMGNQVGFGRLRDTVEVHDGQELLFACGGSMLVDREVFLGVGGFDDGFFAYFEDIDLGWRLNVLGYDVRLASRALSYHRLHGTSSRFPDHQRLFLYERNALRLIAKNYGDEGLRRVLGPALLLAAKRAIVRTGLDRGPYWIGGDREPTEVVPRVALAHLHAMADLVDDLDDVLAKRDAVQRARRRSDAELAHLFVRPMQPVPDEAGFVDAQRRLVAWFGLDALFSERRSTRVAVCAEDVGGRVAAMAAALDDIAAVTVAGDDVTLATSADVVLVDAGHPGPIEAALPVPGVVVANLPEPGATVAARVLDAADVFVCSSPEAAESWSATLEEDGRADARTSMTVVRSASDAAGWRSSAAPVREVVRRPWTVRRPRRTPSSWTEDAQVVLEHRQAEIDALKTGIDELREVVDHQEAQLARLRRLPGFTTVKRVARLWQRVRDRGATGEG